MAKSKGKGVPRVKTGARAGRERSRRKDGGWRRKRNDAGKPRKPRQRTKKRGSKKMNPALAGALGMIAAAILHEVGSDLGRAAIDNVKKKMKKRKKKRKKMKKLRKDLAGA